MMLIRRFLFPILVLLTTQFCFSQSLLNPTTTEPGTKEESGIITTLALTYVKVRNTVRDAYMSIQYTKAMIQTLDDQKEWVKRNLKGWDEVKNRVIKLTTEPGRWDNKLVEMEKIFDKTDYLFFEESKNFDDLMYRQERYATAIGEMGSFINNSHPYVSDFFKFNGSLYRTDPGYIAPFKGADSELDAIYRDEQAEKLAKVKEALSHTQEGRVRDATILAASRAQAQIAALRRMQKDRSDAFQSNLKLLEASEKANDKELGRTLIDLKGLDNDLDDLTLRKLELELILAQFGTQIFELGQKRSSEIRTAYSAEDLANALSPP